MIIRLLKGACCLSLAIAATGYGTARADDISDFYKGRNLTIYVGFGAGGGYDLYARLVAAHYGRHIPGNPNLIVKNMPGGGTRKAAAYIANATAQDGATLGMFVDTLALDTALRPEPKFSMNKFVRIGRVAAGSKLAFTWHTAPAKSVRDAVGKEITIAAISPGSTSSMIPLVLNSIVGTKFKPIVGYRGSAAMALAAERGETDAVGAIGWEVLKGRHADWMRDKKVNLLYIASVNRIRELPDVPALPEFAKTADDRKVLTALGSATEIGRSLAAEPGIPKGRADALRKAYAGLIRDRKFLADGEKRKLDIDPLDGEALAKVVAEVVAMPRALVDRLNVLSKAKLAKKK